MKGKLNRGVPVSPAESLIIGTEVEIIATMEMHYLCRIPSGKQVPISVSAIDITDFSPIIDWEQRRYEIAKACLAQRINSEHYRINDLIQGLTESEATSIVKQMMEALIKSSVVYADELIKQLKGEQPCKQ